MAYKDADIATFGVEAFFASFSYVDAEAFLATDAHLFNRIALDPEQAFNPVKITP